MYEQKWGAIVLSCLQTGRGDAACAPSLCVAHEYQKSTKTEDECKYVQLAADA